MHDFKDQSNKNVQKDNVEITNTSQPRAHFVNIESSSSVITLSNWGELVSLPVHYSFVRVATSGFWIIPYTLVLVVVCAQMRRESGIALYSLQHGIVIVVLVMSPDWSRRNTYGTNIHSEAQYT